MLMLCCMAKTTGLSILRDRILMLTTALVSTDFHKGSAVHVCSKLSKGRKIGHGLI